MSKISKLLVMAVVILAVVTIAGSVNAATADLSNYVTTAQNINGMIFEIPNADKVNVRDYLATSVTDAQADAALAKIHQAAKLVADQNVNRVENLSKEVKREAISLAQAAAADVNLVLEVNTVDNSYVLKTPTGKVLSSGAVAKFITYQEAPSGNPAANPVGAAGTSAGPTFLNTGANYAVYAVVALAIVAVAVVVKKRA